MPIKAKMTVLPKSFSKGFVLDEIPLEQTDLRNSTPFSSSHPLPTFILYVGTTYTHSTTWKIRAINFKRFSLDLATGGRQTEKAIAVMYRVRAKSNASSYFLCHFFSDATA